MQKSLLLLFIVCASVLLSCKDEQPQMRLTKTTLSNGFPHYRQSRTFSYTEEGLLQTSNFSGYIYDNQIYTYSYDDSKRIKTLHIRRDMEDVAMLEHSYDANGRLDSTTYTRLSNPTSLTYKTFLYDEKGHMIRVNSISSTNQVTLVTLLEYDAAGNVIQESFHSISPTGELYAPVSKVKISYDTKKNPQYKLGAPGYSFTYEFIESQYAMYYSPNNPIKVESFDRTNRPYTPSIYTCKYNQEGFPVVKINYNDTLQLEYAIM